MQVYPLRNLTARVRVVAIVPDVSWSLIIWFSGSANRLVDAVSFNSFDLS